MTKDITVVIGPTGIGKTKKAIEIAQKNGGDIISADAFQVYTGMNIGTAKPTHDELRQANHHLIDIKHIEESYSVAEFKKLTDRLIPHLRAQNKPIIICGGTGLFINAFLYNFNFPKCKEDPEYRLYLENFVQKEGAKALHQLLETIDKNVANSIEYQNTRRVIRALETYKQTGEKPSEIRKKHPTIRQDTHIIGLKAERSTVINRIHTRVDHMFNIGLIEEVENLLKQASSPNLQAFEALGYKETIAYLNRAMTKQECIDLIKTKTRQFSKRQMTWFRKIENIEWFNI